MITLLFGNDRISLENFIKSLKVRYKPSQVYVIESPINYINFKDFVDSYGLFSGPEKLILAKPKKDKELDFEESLISKLLKKKEVHVVIDCSKLKLSKNIQDKFTLAQVKKFNVLPSKTSFKISDEVLINQNKAMALKLINDSINIDEEFYLIIGAMQYTIRSYFSYKYKNNISKTINPFVIRKLSAIKYDEDKMKDMHSKLLELDIRSKSTNESLKNLLMDFVISI